MAVCNPEFDQLSLEANVSSRSPESPLLTTGLSNNYESITFQVPDDDENDSFSEQSGEDSVQILDSDVRAYSVPFSDDDLGSEGAEEVEYTPDSIPLGNFNEKHPASEGLGTASEIGRTSENPVHIWNEPTPAEDLLLVGPNKAKDFKPAGTGTPPISLVRFDYGSTYVCSDSEDEEPEILSSKRKQHGTDQVKSSTPSKPLGSQLLLNLVDQAEHSKVHQTAIKNDGMSSDEADVVQTKLQPKTDGIVTSMREGLQKKSTGSSPSNSTDNFHDEEDEFDNENCFPSDPLGSQLLLNLVDQAEHKKVHQAAIKNDGMSSDEAGVAQTKLQSQADNIVTSMREGLQKKSTGSSPSNSTDNFHEEDEFDDENCFPSDPAPSCTNCSLRSHACGSSHVYPPASRPRVSFYLGDNTADESVLAKHWSRPNPIIYERQESQLRTIQRPPSPSDAALAKNGCAGWLSGREEQSHSSYNFSDFTYASRETACHKSGVPWPSSAFQSNNAREGSYLDNNENQYPRYDDGPFAHKNTLPTPTTPGLSSVYPLSPIIRKIASPTPQPSRDCTDNEIPIAESSSPPTASKIATVEASGEFEHRPRLNISDIVNPLTDSSRNSKRKADEISSHLDEAHANEQALRSYERSRTELMLQREGPSDLDTENDNEDDAAFVTIGKLGDAMPLFPELPKDTITVDVVGPALKKQKTSSSSAAGIGKFVSGVLVGVAGAFAAFVATIPMSVQDEALQELAKTI